jgi:WD40 repeat protein
VADSGSELLVFSPDGRTLAACCLALRLWNVVDAAHPAPIGQPLFIVPSNGGFDYAYSPDGTVLATADGLDSTVSLWNVTDTSAPRKIGAALDSVSGDALVAFSADRTLLATFTTTGAIQLWTLR